MHCLLLIVVMAVIKCEKIYPTGVQTNINFPLFELFVNIGGTFILWLTHHLYSIIIGIYLCIVYFLTRVKNIFTLCVSSKVLCESTNKLTEKIRCYTKKPQHVAIILGTESVSYKDLVNLIIWCFIAEISNISFYDHKNGKFVDFLRYVYFNHYIKHFMFYIF